jgi:hypothetical protein
LNPPDNLISDLEEYFISVTQIVREVETRSAEAVATMTVSLRVVEEHEQEARKKFAKTMNF